ncbi:MAG: cob(I)yrinic acid a,c-diamide adenosyltransferase [Bacteroidetes bacterium]|nr:cob(I)yrinic acid a,c-diamide adenosyltransferase [Bacteroidota bacterium]
MAKIYTKGGDLGETSLLNGTRVSKSHDRVEAYGTLDELNSYIGLLRDHLEQDHYREFLLRIQENIFIAEAWIAADPKKTTKGLPEFAEEEITLLEQEIDRMTSELPPLNSFILPGGHPLVSLCHIVRSICRRAERRVIRLQQQSTVSPAIIRYLNRLSDFFFVMARKLGKESNIREISWPQKNK